MTILSDLQRQAFFESPFTMATQLFAIERLI